jgi:hypothetical protein
MDYSFLSVFVRLYYRIAPAKFRVDVSDPDGRVRHNHRRRGSDPINEHLEGLRTFDYRIFTRLIGFAFLLSSDSVGNACAT